MVTADFFRSEIDADLEDAKAEMVTIRIQTAEAIENLENTLRKAEEPAPRNHPHPVKTHRRRYRYNITLSVPQATPLMQGQQSSQNTGPQRLRASQRWPPTTTTHFIPLAPRAV